MHEFERGHGSVDYKLLDVNDSELVADVLRIALHVHSEARNQTHDSQLALEMTVLNGVSGSKPLPVAIESAAEPVLQITAI
ncbi:MAG: hypothetical protein V4719_14815 [Planctomycetota bacterium]